VIGTMLNNNGFFLSTRCGGVKDARQAARHASIRLAKAVPPTWNRIQKWFAGLASRRQACIRFSRVSR